MLELSVMTTPNLLILLLVHCCHACHLKNIKPGRLWAIHYSVSELLWLLIHFCGASVLC